MAQVLSEVAEPASARGPCAIADHLRPELQRIEAEVAPLWPLRDMVAVNPFVGQTANSFWEVCGSIASATGQRPLMMPLSYFQKGFDQGDFSRDDIERALLQLQTDAPEQFESLTLDGILAQVAEQGCGSDTRATVAVAHAPAHKPGYAPAETLAGLAAGTSATPWEELIVGECTKFLSIYYDEGQAAWQNPWKDQPLFAAWSSYAAHDRRPELLGLKGFREQIAELSTQPAAAIEQMLSDFPIDATQAAGYLRSVLSSVAGWASFAKYQDQYAPNEDLDSRRSNHSAEAAKHVLGVLAIRLAFEWSLLRAGLVTSAEAQELFCTQNVAAADSEAAQASLSICCVLQLATEIAYRRQLLSGIRGRVQPSSSAEDEDAVVVGSRATAELAFCIDVRSEIFRRNLESTSADVRTRGFAGFFGVPIEHLLCGDDHGSAQCPVLLKPGYKVREVGCEDAQQLAQVAEQRNEQAAWRLFQKSATACFTFVETLGLLFAWQLFVKTLRGWLPELSISAGKRAHCDGADVDINASVNGSVGIAPAARLQIAETIVRRLGLGSDAARIVALVGHSSTSQNNPLRAGLECGACGGHSGESNAKVAAEILNDERVRVELQRIGLELPQDTVFLAGVHDTTTDEVRLFNTDRLPSSYATEVDQLKCQLETAAMRSRFERSKRLGETRGDGLFRRAADWAEVRPEWGLAGNAAFIAAPRHMTRHLRLGGRVFLHDYDQTRDHDLRTLELIMTAPMVVANWINLQYYGSTVDNSRLGCGDKTVHNVIGGFGILAGNSGDLRGGLAWQSVHDGVSYQHEPLRLQVILAADRNSIDRILEQHAGVMELVRNGWLHLLAIEADEYFRFGADGRWHAEAVEDWLEDSKTEA